MLDSQKNLARAAADFERVLGGFVHFEAMVAGVRLGLFELLAREGPTDRDAVAAALGVPLQSVRALLQSLVGTGLVLAHEGEPVRYSAGPAATLFLVPGAPSGSLAVVDAFHELVYRPMFQLTDALKQGRNVGVDALGGSGPTLYERVAATPHLEHVFHEWMSKGTPMAHATLQGIPEIGKARTLVDVGGGDGSNALFLCQAYPNLHVTILDAPTVCERAKEKIAAAGLTSRCSTVPGDMFRDPFPQGTDVILLSRIVNIYSPDKNRALLRKAYAALNAGGSTAILTSLADAPGADPLAVARLSLYFIAAATGEGMVYDFADILGWIEETDYRAVTRYEPNPALTLICASKE